MTDNEKGARLGLLQRKRMMLRSARHRAKQKGLPFNITINDFDIPDRCPALGIEITLAGSIENAPSLDRVVPAMGYVKGNVVVLSNRANRIKNDASPYELHLIADFLENFINKDWMKS